MSNTTPTIRMIHQLPFAGGTLIGKCIGAMRSVTLLSEIAPYDGASAPTTSLLPAANSQGGGPAVATVHHPLYQACYWFRLVRPEELEPLSRELDHVDIIQLLQRRASERGQALIIRDSLHLDFWAKPGAQQPTFQLSFANMLAQRLSSKRVFTVRHPLDMWLSWRSHGSELDLDFETFMRGCRAFAEIAAEHRFHRYEDFVKQPSRVLAQICHDLDVTYDETYESRWFNYRLITGDIDSTRNAARMLPAARRTGDGDVLRIACSNLDYQATLALLGYASLQHEPLAA